MIGNSILAIDDDQSICQLISATAEAMGLSCTATTESAIFLDAIGPQTSLIMIDLTHGVSAARPVRSRRPACSSRSIRSSCSTPTCCSSWSGWSKRSCRARWWSC